jgi:tyrocidine synthetase-3
MSNDENRFYQGLCAPYAHEPTRDRVRVIECGAKGEGVVAVRPVKKDEIVFSFWGRVLDHQTLFTLQRKPGAYVEDPLVMGKILHSCDPNMACDMATQTFTAVKPIKPGEYLSMDYETTEDELFRSFMCLCGSKQCRGMIQGKAVSFEKKKRAV